MKGYAAKLCENIVLSGWFCRCMRRSLLPPQNRRASPSTKIFADHVGYVSDATGPTRVLAERCMRLDLREMAVKPLADGKIPIVPGEPDKSEMVRRVLAADSPFECRRFCS
jgi:hypothetical protein